jgi:hypothetical protein
MEVLLRACSAHFRSPPASATRELGVSPCANNRRYRRRRRPPCRQLALESSGTQKCHGREEGGFP